MTVPFSRAERFAETVVSANHPAVEKMFTQWVHRYSAWSIERYKACSRGDGDWPPLAASTLYARARRPITRAYAAHRAGDMTDEQFMRSLGRARAKYRKTMRSWLGLANRDDVSPSDLQYADVKGLVSILIDTGTLLAALDVGGYGNTVRRSGAKVEYGIAGPEQHPGGKTTIAEIAKAHQEGSDRLPQRKILVYPAASVIAGMRDDALRMLNAVARTTE